MTQQSPPTSLKLDPRLHSILEQEYPRFSDAEYARRHRLLGEAMETAGVDHLLVVTDHRAGNAPQWVTGWPGTVEAYVIFRPGVPMTMFMEWYNHFPLGRKIARDCDVYWGEHKGIAKTIAELKRRGAKRVGIMGPLVVSKYRQLEEHFQMVGLDAEYIRLRTIKSEEEIDWLRIGAAFSDAGFAALLAGTRPGLTERELGNAVERAYVGHGGTTMIHYIGVTSMEHPHIFVPPQHHSPRKVQKGDVVFCELSAFFWDYPGQVLRSFTVDAEPAALYRDLHATAEAAFDAVTSVVRHGATMEEILEATGVIENNGFTVCDDLMHGFGGGYFQPIIGSRSRMAGPLPDMRLEENMTVVVQPNVITRDQKAGVQVGELIRVTRDGFERLHKTPRGFFMAGAAL
ncbi:MAG: aminopeptidase P family protein [Betaproteobacteria bacterium]|nr:aminopeptidase P family protein [Betaproteobacteria bacterium]